MEATSVFLAVRSGDDVIATIEEYYEVFSLWSAPRLYTEAHRACRVALLRVWAGVTLRGPQ
jgi:hypothetical protein